jgi:hypothetical protein
MRSGWHGRKSSLADLLPERYGGDQSTANDTPLARRCNALLKKPLDAFQAEDLRVMILQGIAIEYLVPMALDLLENDPLVKGDYYPGDLLNAVLSVTPSYWTMKPTDSERLDLVVSRMTIIPEELEESLRQYRSEKRFRRH